MKPSEFAERMSRARLGGAVKRYHTHALHDPGNDASHSWFVALVVGTLYQANHPRLVTQALGAVSYALVHDLGEYDVGDVPAWVKRSLPTLGALLEVRESSRLRELSFLPVAGELSEHGEKLVGWADQLDHLAKCAEERRLGNRNVEVMFARGVTRLLGQLEAHSSGYASGQVGACPCAYTIQGYVNELRQEFLGANQDYQAVEQHVANGGDYFSRLANKGDH